MSLQIAQLEWTLDLGLHGGAETFFADINADGRLEMITYQGPGIFGARAFCEQPKIKPFLPRHTAVSAFDMTGRILWTWGEPQASDRPYLSHGNEACVSVGDVDGDGRPEVVVALGDAVTVLDGVSGRERRSGSLPEDYFYIVHALDAPTGMREAAIVIKNSEAGYHGAPHGQPVMGLNRALELVWGPKTVPGGGHHILTVPMPDGRPGYWIGYCAVRPDGTIAWMADAIVPENLDARLQHVDYTDHWRAAAGRNIFAMAAGTPHGYVVADGGGTIFRVEDEHVQGVAGGRFVAGDDDAGDNRQVAFYNCHGDTAISLYDLRGKRLWRRKVARRHWDMSLMDLSMPDGTIRRFHRSRPKAVIYNRRYVWGYDVLF